MDIWKRKKVSSNLKVSRPSKSTWCQIYMSLRTNWWYIADIFVHGIRPEMYSSSHQLCHEGVGFTISLLLRTTWTFRRVGFAEKQHPKLQTFQVSKNACTTCGGSIPETFLIRKSGCCCLLCISYPISCMHIMLKVKYRNNRIWTNNFKISDHLKTDSVAACVRDFWWPSVSLHQWHRISLFKNHSAANPSNNSQSRYQLL